MSQANVSPVTCSVWEANFARQDTRSAIESTTPAIFPRTDKRCSLFRETRNLTRSDGSSTVAAHRDDPSPLRCQAPEPCRSVMTPRVDKQDSGSSSYSVRALQRSDDWPFSSASMAGTHWGEHVRTEQRSDRGLQRLWILSTCARLHLIARQDCPSMRFGVCVLLRCQRRALMRQVAANRAARWRTVDWVRPTFDGIWGGAKARALTCT
jgi:hypothetical protein